jgi:hypothetical protein
VAALVQVILVVLGALGPTLLQGWIQGYRFIDYSPLQATNWTWTLVEAAEGNLWLHPTAPILVPLAATAVFIANLFLTTAEVEEVRQATPDRVLQDEADEP